MMKVKNAQGKWEDRTIEMGAVMGCDTYFAVHACGEEFGGTTHLDGPPMGRRFVNADGTPQKSSPLALLKKHHEDEKALESSSRRSTRATMSTVTEACPRVVMRVPARLPR